MRADRLLSIMMTLQARGRVTATELAETMEVSERTIYRDLDALSASGVPIYADRGPGGGYKLLEGYRSGLTALTEGEMRSLLVASIPGPLAALDLEKPLQDALLKLLASLPYHRREEAQRQRTLVHLDTGPWFRDEIEETPYLATLHQALWESRRIQMVYRTGSGEENLRKIEPYGLVAKAQIWYVVASTPRGMRVYRVSRILSASLVEEYFTPPDDFDLSAFWHEWRDQFMATIGQYPVRVRFAPVIQEHLSSYFGSSVVEAAQTTAPDADGWLTLDVTYDHIDHACTHLLGMGDVVEVLEPQELRQSIIKAAQGIAALYDQP